MTTAAVDAGSADKTVRLWSLDAGMPLATSRSHSGTVRALALDEHLLVSASNLARPHPAPHMLGRHARGLLLGLCWRHTRRRAGPVSALV